VILKPNLSPAKVWSYVWKPVTYAALVAVAVAAVREIAETEELAVPFAPIGTVGAAVAIFVAFRNNVSYARWWEGRTLWSSGLSSSRVLARQLVAATDNAMAAGVGGTAEEILAYRREMVLRVVAIGHALRIELRETNDWETVRPLLPPDEFAQLLVSHNRPNMLIQRQGIRVKDGVRAGIVGQFDPISLEPGLAALNAWVAGCERIKHTPTPRQYDYFTRASVAVFSTVLPFGLASLIGPTQPWMLVIISVLVSTLFVVLERVGAVVESPFQNTVTDVPMTSISNTIERDLLEQIGEVDLPEQLHPVDGYLW
jgi:ion channel-forming bestrophin family protein